MLLQVSDSGELVLPGELLQAAPHTQFRVERLGTTVVIEPVPTESSAESIIEFWNSYPALSDGPIEASTTFRREEIYGDDGR